MTNFQPGDLLLVNFPLTTSGPGKPRPALVVLDTGDADVLLARVTTQPRATTHDVVVSEWFAAGLLAPSIVRVHKLATIDKARVHRKLGSLQEADYQSVAAVLRTIASSW